MTNQINYFSTPQPLAAWLPIPIAMIGDSDFDTLRMIMMGAFGARLLSNGDSRGMSLRITLKPQALNRIEAQTGDPLGALVFDAVLVEADHELPMLRENDDQEPTTAHYISEIAAGFDLLGSDYEPTGTIRYVRWIDIAEIGVY